MSRFYPLLMLLVLLSTTAGMTLGSVAQAASVADQPPSMALSTESLTDLSLIGATSADDEEEDIDYEDGEEILD